MMVVDLPESNVASQEIEKSPQPGFISSNMKDQITGQAGGLGLSQDELLPNAGGAATKNAILPPEILEQYDRFLYGHINIQRQSRKLLICLLL